MIRRVITGHIDGKAVVLGDGAPPKGHVFKKIPGMESALAWATTAEPVVGQEGKVEAVLPETTLLPRVGETRLVFLTLPPDSVMMAPDFDHAGAMTEFSEHQPEMAAIQEAANPGMHRTDTIDYVIVLDGEIHLELDDGKAVLLKRHEVVIQAGTRHAWRNKSDRPASLAVVLVGARRLTP